MQYMEKEQLDIWKLTRPGDRIVDIGKSAYYTLKPLHNTCCVARMGIHQKLTKTHFKFPWLGNALTTKK